MSRSRRFVAGIITGYGSIAANIFYTMASVPLALHFLGREQFGLWALAIQINGYLQLIDLGMNSSVSRFLADHKDDVNGGEYGSHLLTGGLVFTVQGAAIAVMGAGLAWFAPTLFNIPGHLSGSFTVLLILLALTTGTSVALRSIGAPLWAFQRMDIVNTTGAFGLILSFCLLWLGFGLGWGIYSFAFAQIPPIGLTILSYARTCFKYSYYPTRGNWSSPRWKTFTKMFDYGKDMLLISLGSQFVNGSQIMIISRVLGLDAAATFSISTKLYTMGMQIVGNLAGSAAPGLTELHVRGDNKRFVERYWNLTDISLALATIAAIGIAVGNSAFISIWTGGAISWQWYCDTILALLVIVKNVTGCLTGLFGVTKGQKAIRYTYLVEALAFIVLGAIGAKYLGLFGVLIASLAAHLLITAPLILVSAKSVLGSYSKLREHGAIAIFLLAVSSAVAFSESIFEASAPLKLVTAFVAVVAAIITTYLSIFPAFIRSKGENKLCLLLFRVRKFLEN